VDSFLTTAITSNESSCVQQQQAAETWLDVGLIRQRRHRVEQRGLRWSMSRAPSKK